MSLQSIATVPEVIHGQWVQTATLPEAPGLVFIRWGEFEEIAYTYATGFRGRWSNSTLVINGGGTWDLTIALATNHHQRPGIVFWSPMSDVPVGPAGPIGAGVLSGDLAGIPGSATGQVYRCSGVAAVGYGHGWFRWSAGTAPAALAGMIVPAAGGWWTRDYTGAVDITWLGCKDDGSVDCGALINAYLVARHNADGVNTQVTLTVPPITAGQVGWKLTTGIRIPGQMALTIQGSGAPYIDGLLWTVSTTGCHRSGPVFTVPANVTALAKATPGDGTVPTVRLERLGFVGPGGSAGSGYGVDCATGLVATTDKVHIAGFAIGFRAVSVVSLHGVKDLKCTGCVDGVHVGATGTNNEFVDGEWYGLDVEYNQQGVVIEVARDCYFYGGLVQGNYNGVVVGNAGGTHSIRGVHLGFNHYEANGDDASNGAGTPATPWGTAGGKHLVLKSGGTIDTLHVCGSTAGGIVMPATTPRDITVPAGANVRFDRCFMSGLLTVAAGGFVEILSAARDGGFTGFSLSTNCVASWLSRGTNGGQLSGTYTHDWAASGPVLRKQLTGNVTISGVTNIPDGEIVTFFFIQDATASRTVTWDASFIMDSWSNTGFAIAGSRSTISFMANAGGLMQIAPQPAGKWLL